MGEYTLLINENKNSDYQSSREYAQFLYNESTGGS